MAVTPYPYELEQLARETGVSPLETLELFLERAAIREYDGGYDRAEAELLALEDTRDVFTRSRRNAQNAADQSEPVSTGSQRIGEPITSSKRGTMPQGGGR